MRSEKVESDGAARRIAARPAAPEGVVRVAEADARGFRQDVVIGRRHPLVADEPASLGGTDLGPNPYQFLSAGLGARTTMTIRMYARRKGIADPCRLRRDA